LQRIGTQFDSILKRGLGAQRTAEPGGCPDEATLAAYCDRTLPAAEVTRWEEHLAGCARCQGTLAAMARARTPQLASRVRSLSRRWEPYAALAAALAGISIVVSSMHPVRNKAERMVLYSQASSAPGAAHKARPQIALNQAREEKQPEAPPSREAPAPRPDAGDVGASTENRLAKTLPLPPGRDVNELGGRAESASRRLASPNALETAYVSGSAGVAPNSAHDMANQEYSARIPSGVEPRAAIGGLMGAPLRTRGVGLAMIPVRTPDDVERWRLFPNGTIEHLEPNGSWQEQTSGVTSNLRAGAAPSPTTCWIVGAGGTILRTVDGEHWQRINSPTSADLLAVYAMDASTATITNDRGKSFSTSDGGATWRQI